jgi:hypothetical protein
LLGGVIFPNLAGILVKDAGGTAHAAMFMDGSNNLWVGSADAASPNGSTLLYAGGTLAATLTPAGVVQVGSGDLLLGSTPTGLDVRRGTFASPLTAAQPNVKISRVEQISAVTQPNPSDGDLNAALVVLSQGTGSDTPQVTAIKAAAYGGSTNAGNDICAVSAIGQLLNSGGTGYAMGAYLEGRRDYATGKAYGAEITVNNQTATPGAYSTTAASDTMGIWLISRGLSGVDNAVGMAVAAFSGSQWVNGIGFIAGSILTNSIRDDSSAATTLLINGTHATAAIGIADGSGFVGIGTQSPTAPLHVAGTITNPATAGVILAPTINMGTTGKAIVSVQAGVIPTASLTNVYGMLFIPGFAGTEGVTTNPVSTIDGVYVRVDTFSNYDSAVNAVTNFHAEGVSHAGGGTISTLYGYYSGINAGTARVSTSWQIYCAGDAPSYFGGNIQIADKDIALGTTTGTKIGTATTQKLAFWNATPIVRPSAYTQTYATADKTHANPTATALTAASGTSDGTVADVGASFNQTTLNNNFKDVATAINAVIVDIADLKQLVNSVIDDLQALGLVA